MPKGPEGADAFEASPSVVRKMGPRWPGGCDNQVDRPDVRGPLAGNAECPQCKGAPRHGLRETSVSALRRPWVDQVEAVDTPIAGWTPCRPLPRLWQRRPTMPRSWRRCGNWAGPRANVRNARTGIHDPRS